MHALKSRRRGRMFRELHGSSLFNRVLDVGNLFRDNLKGWTASRENHENLMQKRKKQVTGVRLKRFIVNQHIPAMKCQDLQKIMSRISTKCSCATVLARKQRTSDSNMSGMLIKERRHEANQSPIKKKINARHPYHHAPCCPPAEGSFEDDHIFSSLMTLA